MDSTEEMAYSDENARIEDESSQSSDVMDLSNYWPTIYSCVQYTAALVNIQRAKGLESYVIDIIGVFLALFRRDSIYFVSFEGEVKQFSSVQGHSGISKNWTVQLGWQLPFAGVGSRLMNSEFEVEGILEHTFGNDAVGEDFECRNPIFPNMFEEEEDLESIESEAETQSSGSFDSPAEFLYQPGGRLVRQRDLEPIQNANVGFSSNDSDSDNEIILGVRAAIDDFNQRNLRRRLSEF